MGDAQKKWKEMENDFRRSDIGKFVNNPGQAITNLATSGVTNQVRPYMNATAGALPGIMDANNRERIGQENLINSIEEENKKTAKSKADLAARALADTQARLMRERKPGMANKNKTILTSPLGIQTSMIKPRKTLLGE